MNLRYLLLQFKSSIKKFLVKYIFNNVLKIESKFQNNTKKFYFSAILFTLIIFSFTFFSPSLPEKKEVVLKEPYTVIQSTNLLSVNSDKVKGKIIFRPRLSKAKRTPKLSDFVAVDQTVDFNTLLLQIQLNLTSSEKIKGYYQKVLGNLLVKKYFKPNDNYITTGLIQELTPDTPKRETSENIRE